MSGYQVDENGRYHFPMMPGDTVRVIADCSCGWAMDGPERVFDWLDDRHAHAHNKGIDGLGAGSRMEIQRIEAAGPEAEGSSAATADPAPESGPEAEP